MTVLAESISLRNAANAQFSTGPRTPEGKAVSRENATVHGFCSVEPRSTEDWIEAEAIYAMLDAELKPATPMEVEAVREAAHADQRRRRLGRALDEVFENAAEFKCDERKDQLEIEQNRCQADVRFWTALMEAPPTPGKGLEPAELQAALTRLGVTPGGRNRERDPRVDLILYFQGRAHGGDLLLQTLARRDSLLPGQSLTETDQKIISGSQRGCDGLIDVFQKCLSLSVRNLTEANARAENNRANPNRESDRFDDSKSTRLMIRYQNEASRDYFRALRSFDAIRRRQDAERRQREREERQARKAAQDAEKAARQAARQAAIDARANPPRNEMVAKVAERFIDAPPIRNEPRSADASTEVHHPHSVAMSQPAPVSTPESRRVVHRRGKAVTIDTRRPPNRR